MSIEAVSAFYGTPAVSSPAQPAVVEQPASERSIAEAFYGAKSSSPVEEASALPLETAPGPTLAEHKAPDDGVVKTDVLDVFYGEGITAENGPYSGIRAGVERIAEEFGLTPQQAEESRVATAQFFHDLGVEASDAERLHNIYAQHVVAIPDEATVENWERKSHEALGYKFGDQAEARLNLAREFVRARPELQSLLNATGLGSHPDIVSTLADRVWSLKALGKLKAK